MSGYDDASLTSFEAVARHYLENHAADAARDAGWFGLAARPLAAAIGAAAKSMVPSRAEDRLIRHSHQRRIPPGVLQEAATCVIVAEQEIGRCSDFASLHRLVEDRIGAIPGVGCWFMTSPIVSPCSSGWRPRTSICMQERGGVHGRSAFPRGAPPLPSTTCLAGCRPFRRPRPRTSSASTARPSCACERGSRHPLPMDAELRGEEGGDRAADDWERANRANKKKTFSYRHPN